MSLRRPLRRLVGFVGCELSWSIRYYAIVPKISLPNRYQSLLRSSIDVHSVRITGVGYAEGLHCTNLMGEFTFLSPE
jgi:hypothetical protein